MDDMDGIEKLKEKRLLEQVLLALGFTIAFGLTLSLSTILSGFDAEQEAFLKYGLIVSTVLGFYFFAVAITLTRNPALALARLTPLSPALYYRHTLGKFVLPLLALVFAVPLMFLFFFSVSGYTARFRGGPFPLNLILTYYVLLLAPFHEQLSSQSWSYVFLFPRKLLRPALRLLLSSGWVLVGACLLAAAACIWCRPWANFTRGMDALLELGVWGRIVYYLAIPFAGVLHFHGPSVPMAAQWGLTMVLATAVVLMVRTVVRQWFLSPQDWDKAVFEEWVNIREDFEDTESRIEEAQESRKRFLFTNAHHDGFWAAGEGEIAQEGPQVRGTEYDPDLKPEETLVRHSRFWFGHSLGFPSFWAGFVAVGWVLFAALRHNSWANAATRETLEVLFAPAFLWLASVGFQARADSLAWLPPIPLRWPALIRADYLFQRPYLLAMDCLAALLITVAVFQHLVFFPAALATILMSRCSAYAHAWLATAHGAGRRWGYWIQICAWGGFWASLMPVCIIFAGLSSSPLSERRIYAMLFAFIWIGGVFVVSGALLLVEWLHSGVQVAGSRFSGAALPIVPMNTNAVPGEYSADS